MNEYIKDIMDKLADPFPASDIEWRIQNAGLKGNGEPYAMVIPYVTARGVQERLDNVFGLDGWKNEFSTGPGGGVLCGLSVRINGEWITKYDGADSTKIEPVKGGLSDAMKRAAVQFGVARYLYFLPAYYALCFSKPNQGQNYQVFQSRDKKTKVIGSWDAPMLPDFALPHQVLEMRLQTHIEQIKACEGEEQLKKVFKTIYLWAKDDVQDIDFVKRVEAVYKTQKNNIKIAQTKNGGKSNGE